MNKTLFFACVTGAVLIAAAADDRSARAPHVAHTHLPAQETQFAADEAVDITVEPAAVLARADETQQPR